MDILNNIFSILSGPSLGIVERGIYLASEDGRVMWVSAVPMDAPPEPRNTWCIARQHGYALIKAVGGETDGEDIEALELVEAMVRKGSRFHVGVLHAISEHNAAAFGPAPPLAHRHAWLRTWPAEAAACRKALVRVPLDHDFSAGTPAELSGQRIRPDQDLVPLHTPDRAPDLTVALAGFRVGHMSGTATRGERGVGKRCFHCEAGFDSCLSSGTNSRDVILSGVEVQMACCPRCGALDGAPRPRRRRAVDVVLPGVDPDEFVDQVATLKGVASRLNLSGLTPDGCARVARLVDALEQWEDPSSKTPSPSEL